MGGRLCLRMVNRQKLNHFEVKKTLNKAFALNSG